MEQQEIWKDIPEYEGLYQVSNQGGIMSLKSSKGNKILKHTIDKDGYVYVRLFKNNTPKSHFVHRLVAAAFIPNPENKPQVNHINNVRGYNFVENLEWSTNKENVLHSYNMGRVSKGKFNPKFGEQNNQSKLNSFQVLEIRQRMKVVNSYADLAKEYNVTPAAIRSIILEKTWKHVL